MTFCPYCGSRDEMTWWFDERHRLTILCGVCEYEGEPNDVLGFRVHRYGY
jgi:Zn ribbon nucleic-acid-binding protein